MIVCLAVVGHQNNPLYIQSFTEADDALKLHHIVHCSLDVVEERATPDIMAEWVFSFVFISVNNPKKSGPTINEAFLGLLYPTENYKVYGYLTNTKVKFILVTTDLDVRDVDVRNNSTELENTYGHNVCPVNTLVNRSCFVAFRKFHAAYVDAVTNPFHIPEILAFRQSIYSGIASEWFTPRFGFDVSCYTVSNIIEEVT
ncbi:trafficking protein particle complex subunit 2-like protein, partial [Striga asiatica]